MVAETKAIYEEMEGGCRKRPGKRSLNVGNYSDAAKGLTTQIENQTEAISIVTIGGSKEPPNISN